MKYRLIKVVIFLNSLWLIPFGILHSQAINNSNSVLTLYQESSTLKDSCIVVLLGILDTLDPNDYRNLTLYHKITKSLSSDISNENISNYFFNHMNVVVPNPDEWTDDIYKEYPYLSALISQSSWGIMKPLINYLSIPRKQEDLYICMSIIESISKKRISDPIINMIQYLGNKEVKENMEIIRTMLKK